MQKKLFKKFHQRHLNFSALCVFLKLLDFWIIKEIFWKHLLVYSVAKALHCWFQIRLFGCSWLGIRLLLSLLNKTKYFAICLKWLWDKVKYFEKKVVSMQLVGLLQVCWRRPNIFEAFLSTTWVFVKIELYTAPQVCICICLWMRAAKSVRKKTCHLFFGDRGLGVGCISQSSTPLPPHLYLPILNTFLFALIFIPLPLYP